MIEYAWDMKQWLWKYNDDALAVSLLIADFG